MSTDQPPDAPEPVTVWIDRSGNGRHAVSVHDSQPDFKVSLDHPSSFIRVVIDKQQDQV